jgi:hypothetical protein
MGGATVKRHWWWGVAAVVTIGAATVGGTWWYRESQWPEGPDPVIPPEGCRTFREVEFLTTKMTVDQVLDRVCRYDRAYRLGPFQDAPSDDVWIDLTDTSAHATFERGELSFFRSSSFIGAKNVATAPGRRTRTPRQQGFPARRRVACREGRAHARCSP